VLAFSHADPIKAAVTFAQGVPLDLFQRTDIAPCSMSVLQFSDHAPFVRGVNLVGSLKDVLR
jgi:probable phosphoglycerate mutase